jgi:hypothetical protein
MSSVGILDAAGATRAIDTFVRTEGAGLVETQAIAVVNPTTGDPLLPTAGGAMPVEGAFFQATQPVSAASLPLPAGAATQATLAALNVIADAISTAVAALNTKATTINTGAIAGTVALDAPTLAALESITAATGGLTNAELRAAAVPVSATFWQATQPVSFTWAGLTDAQLRASAVPMSAASLPLPADAATQTTLASVDGKLPVLDAGRIPVVLPPGGGGLTDSELRAAAVPVSVAGELVEAIEALRCAVRTLTRTVGLTLPDAAGRMRVNLETGTTAVTGTLTGVTTVTTLATLTNQTQVGGLAANEQVPALMRIGTANLRNNILVTA